MKDSEKQGGLSSGSIGAYRPVESPESRESAPRTSSEPPVTVVEKAEPHATEKAEQQDERPQRRTEPAVLTGQVPAPGRRPDRPERPEPLDRAERAERTRQVRGEIERVRGEIEKVRSDLLRPVPTPEPEPAPQPEPEPEPEPAPEPEIVFWTDEPPVTDGSA